MSDLISGKEALIALANGEEVEYWCENDPSIQKRWTPIKTLNEYKLSYFLEDKPRFEFRLKPRTITLNGIEVPAPFVPKDGEVYWFLCINRENWYTSTINRYTDSDQYRIEFGVYQTEEEIKQVVEALRVVFK